jgi:hypothetical protein
MWGKKNNYYICTCYMTDDINVHEGFQRCKKRDQLLCLRQGCPHGVWENTNVWFLNEECYVPCM